MLETALQGRDIQSYVQHIGKGKILVCSRVLTNQVWYGNSCFMEPRNVNCGTPVQTNGCPLAGAEKLTLNAVELLATPVPAAAPSKPGDGCSGFDRVLIAAIVIINILLVILLCVCFQRRHEVGPIRLFRVLNYFKRVIRSRETSSDGPHTHASELVEQSRPDDVIGSPESLRMPRRPEPAARLPVCKRYRLPDDQVENGVSQESGRTTLVGSDRHIRHTASQGTLHDSGNMRASVNGSSEGSSLVRTSTRGT